MTVHFSSRRLAGLISASLIPLALAACGSDQAVESKGEPTAGGVETSASSLTGTIAGAGASSQEAAMNAWIANYRSQHPNVTVTYDAVGSGAGITQFTSEQVLWAGSDAPLEGDEITAAQARCGGSAIDIPVYVSPIAVVVNLPGMSSINLDPTTIAKIFTGAITRWDDPAIAATNPQLTLPDLAITAIHRSDKSGTTENFTDYLHQAAPEVWTWEADKSWPIAGGESADKTSGVIQAVRGGEGTIGYADASQVGDLATVALQAGDGFVTLSHDTAARAADAATRLDGRDDNDIALALPRIPDSVDVYPLVLISYAIACTTYDTHDEAALVRDFLSYQVSVEGQNLARDAAGAAPLSDAMRETIMRSLNLITGRDE